MNNSNNVKTYTGHPLIANKQDYMVYHKYVTINSEDRDITKFPNASEFEIELPQDYCNVSTIRLASWTFPANYNSFSAAFRNNIMTFQINDPYNAPLYDAGNALQVAIYNGLLANQNNNYVVILPDGFYNTSQIASALQGLMNAAVTDYLSSYLDPSLGFTSYNGFVIVFNNASNLLWFGNNCDSFILTNTSHEIDAVSNAIKCNNPTLPQYINQGLPAYLGLNPKLDLISKQANTFEFKQDINAGINGVWLQPNSTLPNCQAYYIVASTTPNLFGNSTFYMDIHDFNCIDQTSPYSLNNFTKHTNITNGMVNAAFAKIPIPSTPLSQWYDSVSIAYKFYDPPAERIRKFRLRLRYHNGQLVDFRGQEYSFTLEFTIYLPQIAKKYNLTKPDYYL